MPKTLVILNPISGNGAGNRTWPLIANALHAGGLAFDLHRTTAPRTAIALAEAGIRDGYNMLVAVGGDGTVNEVVNGMMHATGGEPAGTLGIIPVGSGNDFCKMLTAKPHWRTGVEQILAGRPRRVDIVRVTGDQIAPGYDTPTHYFVNVLDTGFGALVARHVQDIPLLKGTPLYLAGVVKALANYSVPFLSTQIDDRCIEQPSTMTAIANGRCLGGGFWIAPTAAADDGLLDVVLIAGLGRRGVVSIVPQMLRGTHVNDPRTRCMQARRITIDSPDPLIVEADGEILYAGAHHLQTEVLPLHLSVLA